MLLTVIAIVALIVLNGVWHATVPLRHKSIEGGVDKFGYRIGYDVHYTRALEVDGEVTVATQCDDKNCRTCYWKPRNKGPGEYVSSAISRRDTFIESLPDGLTDAEYDQRLKVYNNAQKNVRLTRLSPSKIKPQPKSVSTAIWQERVLEKSVKELAVKLKSIQNRADANYTVLPNESVVSLKSEHDADCICWNDAIHCTGWDW